MAGMPPINVSVYVKPKIKRTGDVFVSPYAFDNEGKTARRKEPD